GKFSIAVKQQSCGSIDRRVHHVQRVARRRDMPIGAIRYRRSGREVRIRSIASFYIVYKMAGTAVNRLSREWPQGLSIRGLHEIDRRIALQQWLIHGAIDMRREILRETGFQKETFAYGLLRRIERRS